jgi:hypothetical protein
VAEALKKIQGLDVQLIDGAKSEFTVSVDGREVARKRADLPSVDEVVAVVEDAALAKHDN